MFTQEEIQTITNGNRNFYGLAMEKGNKAGKELNEADAYYCEKMKALNTCIFGQIDAATAKKIYPLITQAIKAAESYGKADANYNTALQFTYYAI